MKFINFAEIGGICNMHHWLRGMDAPVVTDFSIPYFLIKVES